MIEVVSADRCIGCDGCVAVCPTNVFDPGPDGGPPVIARQTDCRTCFLCTACCPVDALFVAPHSCRLPEWSPLRDTEYLAATGLLDSHRNTTPPGPGRIPGAPTTSLAATAATPARRRGRPIDPN